MHHLIATLATFIAITAIPGGVALLLGVEEFPTTWLQGSPFGDFTIPALILSAGVGGSALVTAVLGFIRHRWTGWFAVLAGLAMVGYVAGELVLLQDDAAWPHWIEWLYLAVGALLGLSGVVLIRWGTRWEVVYEANE